MFMAEVRGCCYRAITGVFGTRRLLLMTCTLVTRRWWMTYVVYGESASPMVLTMIVDRLPMMTTEFTLHTGS